MNSIPDAYEKVPMMFQAQTEGRCQLNYIKKGNRNESGVELWTKQWTENSDSHPPDFDETVQTKIYKLSWRFVTNGGQDEGIIRPVISTKGVPFYPGSTMKGAFRQACQQMQPDKVDYYCGNADRPAMLRFHGGYPTDKKWQKNLIDVVHPQQGWQVKTNKTHQKPSGESAFALISLYQPELKFGISSIKILDDTEWETIWSIWEKALGNGIGCRVSSGYGLSNAIAGDVLYQAKLHGKGAASKLLNQQPEFRPNIFRAAIRGHALRIFSGLNQSLADDIVDELLGGIRSNKEKVGLLGMAFHIDSLELDTDDASYNVKGNLIWQLSGKLDKPEHRSYLENLVEKLTQFAMLLGGFGKSWRRADHRIFYPQYKRNLIGCHWCWLEKEKNQINGLNDARKLIQETIVAAEEWMRQRGFEVKKSIPLSTVTSSQDNLKRSQPQLNRPISKPVKRQNQTAQESEWREAWRSDNVQVWGRIAKNKEDSKIISLLHSSQKLEDRQHQNQKTGNYNQPKTTQNQNVNLALQRPTNQNNQSSCPSIYRTCVTGRVKDKRKSDDPTEIGRLWHRMYPLNDEQYLELITIFPNGCNEATPFIQWLSFQKEWEQL